MLMERLRLHHMCVTGSTALQSGTTSTKGLQEGHNQRAEAKARPVALESVLSYNLAPTS